MSKDAMYCRGRAGYVRVKTGGRPRESICVERLGRVAHIQVNRPEAENRMTTEMVTALGHAFTQADDEAEVRALLVTSAGPDFSLGVDVKEALPTYAVGRNPIDVHDVNPWGVVGRRRRKPVITVVQGRCFNGALELALASDICVAANDARFAFQEVRFGTYPFAGGVFRTIRCAGWSTAMRWILTGEEFGADEALKHGVIASIKPPGEARAAGEALARTISEAAPLAVEAALAQADAWAGVCDAAGFGRSIPDIIRLLNTKDVAEALRAMEEGRAPSFSRG
jgi:enoyl-CoA hydratase/carnithine racemase